MRWPRMNVRRWAVVVAFVAAWLAFVARAERLRGMAVDHMRQTQQGPAAQNTASSDTKARAAWHLKMASDYNIEADFVEAFQVAVLLTLVVLGIVVAVRDGRRVPDAPSRQKDPAH